MNMQVRETCGNKYIKTGSVKNKKAGVYIHTGLVIF